MVNTENTAEFAKASSPGRLDVMGGIADYSGSQLLQMPIREQTHVTIRRLHERKVTINSSDKDLASVEFDLNNLYSSNKWVSVQQLKDLVNSHSEKKWSLYILGCFYIFCSKYKLKPVGLAISIHSEVPIGKGVSSSASLEVAMLIALHRLYKVDINDQLLPIMAQKAENEIVGAPCGLMDQLAVYWGKANHLLPIRCQPDEIGKPIPLPRGVYFYGIDSGIRHAVSGNPYGDARTAAFMAYSIIEQSLGTPAFIIEAARVKKDISRLYFQGYLANVDDEEFKKKFEKLLPEVITGAEFLHQYGGLTDDLSNIDPEKSYYPVKCGSHPIAENHRIERFASILNELHVDSKNRIKLLKEAGELMYNSHKGYTDCGLGHKRTDEMVEIAKANLDKGIYGARITGGGSGGTVCFLVDEIGKKTVYDIKNEISEKYQQELYLFEGSSDGAKYI